MGKKRSISFFLVFLIVFHSVAAFGININDPLVVGSSDIEGLCGGINDPVTISLIISGTDTEPLMNDITMDFSDYDRYSIPFTSGEDKVCRQSSCTKISDTPDYTNAYECSCVTDWCPAKDINFKVKYQGVSKTLSLSPDYKPPVINSISITQVANKQVQVSYDVKDEACDSDSDCKSCSGLKEIEVIGSTTLGTIDFSGEACSKTGTEKITIESDEETEIRFKVKDNLWQTIDDDDMHSTEYKTNLDLDFSRPMIASIWKILVDGKEQDYIGSRGIMGATVKVTIKEENLLSIDAKLRQLGNSQDIRVTKDTLVGSNYECISSDDITYVCTFNDIKIRAAAELSFLLKVTDIKGNVVEKTLKKSMNLDTTPPKFEKLESVVTDNGVSFIGLEKNNFVARFTEADSGFDNRNVYMILTHLGGGRIQADRCEQSSGFWNCYFNNVTVTKLEGNSVGIRLDSMSTDDAGNRVTGDMVGQFTVDIIPPEIISFQVYGVGREVTPFYFTQGDSILVNFEVNMTGSPQKEMKVDISQLVSNGGNESLDNCDNKNNVYTCNWDIPKIVQGKTSSVPLTLYVKDAAGNTASRDIYANVYGDLDEVPANFEVKILKDKMIPKKINKLIATTIPNPPGYKILVPFNLIGGDKDVTVLNYNLHDCMLKDPEGTLSREFYETFFMEALNPTAEPVHTLLTNSQANEINQFEFILSSSIPDLDYIDSVTINCTFDIYQAFKDDRYTEPEVENISITFNFIDSVFNSEPSEAITKRIEERREKLKDFKFVDDAAKVVTFLKQICGIFESVSAVWSGLAAIEAVGAGLKNGVVTSGVGKGIFFFGCYGYEIIGKILQKTYYSKKYLPGEYTTKACKKTITDDLVTLAKDRVIDETGKIVQDKVKAGVKREIVRKASNALGTDITLFTKSSVRDWCMFINCQHKTGVTEKILMKTGAGIFDKKLKNSDGKNQKNEKKHNIKDQGADNYFNVLKFKKINESIGVVSYDSKTVTAQAGDSIIMNAASICIPGLIYNVQQYRIINCEYVKCLRDISMQGGDISICSAKKAEATCIAVIGELTDMIGLFKIIENIASSFGNAMKNLVPNGLKLLFDSLICSKNSLIKSDFVKSIACDVPSAFYTLKDTFERSKSFASTYDIGAYELGGGETVCDEVLADDFMMTEEERDLNNGN